MFETHHPLDVWNRHFPEIQERWGRGKELSIDSLPIINKTIWGLHKKKLITIGGRPSQGKSAIALQLAWDFVKQNKEVVLFTFEMTKEDIVERLFCMDQLIDNFDITTGRIGQLMDKGAYKDSLNNFTLRLKDVKLVIIETMGKTFKELFDIVETFKNADCVIIDYIQMIKEKTTTKAAIDEYIKSFREYAIRRNLCAIITSQINRSTHLSGNVKMPEMHELKGTGALEEHSDMVWLVHWEYKYTGENKNDYKLWVCKNRNGRTIMKKCTFEPQYYKLTEVDDEETDDTSLSGTNQTRKDIDD